MQLLLLKLILLPGLMIGITLLCGIRDEYGLSLVLLASCPLAQLAFLLCHQYKAGQHMPHSTHVLHVVYRVYCSE